MKPATLLVLPAMALAAATPQVEERQIPGLPGLPGIPGLPPLPLDLTCLLTITGVTTCVPGGVNAGTVLTNLVGCPLLVILNALDCVVSGLPLPVKE